MTFIIFYKTSFMSEFLPIMVDNLSYQTVYCSISYALSYHSFSFLKLYIDSQEISENDSISQFSLIYVVFVNEVSIKSEDNCIYESESEDSNEFNNSEEKFQKSEEESEIKYSKCICPHLIKMLEKKNYFQNSRNDYFKPRKNQNNNKIFKKKILIKQEF